jgi:uncharacterized protein DUF4398
MTRRSILAVAALTLAGLGCGSYPPPTERMSTAEAAIRAAEEVGATNVPQAALYMKLAQEQTEKAKRMMQDGYNERAELELKRAQADAELAVALAREQDTVGKAQAAQAKLDQARGATKRSAKQ